MDIEVKEGVEIAEEALDEVAGGKAVYYTIVKGDTLIKLANRFGTTVETLCKLNGIKNPDLIKEGHKIRVK